MVHLNIFTNISAAIAAAGNVFILVDFQGNCADTATHLLNQPAVNLGPVQAWPCNGAVANQQWLLTAASFNGSTPNFQITGQSTNIPGTILSTAQFGATAPSTELVGQQAVVQANSSMTWQVIANPNFAGRFNIIPSSSPQGIATALTSWAKRSSSGPQEIDSMTAPLTLTILNQADIQQTFQLTQ